MARALAASEVRYRRLFEAAKDGILILDAESGMIVDVNPFLMELLGYTREDLLGKRVWELGFFKNLAANAEKFAELQAQEYIRYDNLPLETADGRVREVEFVSNVYLADEKRVIQCNIRDITERKRAERRIEQLTLVLRAIRAVNQLIARETDRDALLRRSCEILVSTRGYRSAWVALRKADGTLQAVGESGISECFADVKQMLERGDWPECCRNARDVAEGTALIHYPDRDCRRYALSHTDRDTTALAGALRHDNRDYGMLVVALPEWLGDDQQEQSLFLELVEDLGYALYAIENGQTRIRTERTLQAVFQSASDGILLADAQSGRFILGNDAICRMLGYSPEEIVGLSIADIHPTDALGAVREQFGKQAQGEIRTAQDIPVKRKDGTVFQADVNSGVFELDGRRQVAGFFRDITERKRANESLWQSREVLRAVLDNIPARVFWKDVNLKYLGCNRAFARDAGFEDFQQVTGKDDFAMGWREQAELYRNDDRLVIQDGKPKLLVEEQQTTPTGETIHLLTSKVPLRDAKGSTIGVLGTYMDITDRKRLEEERERLQSRRHQAQKLESLGTLAGGVAHEINNPIMGIMNYAQLILDKLGPEHEVAEFAREIGHETERVAAIVKNLLLFSRQDTRNTSPARMCDIVEGTLSLVRTVLRHDQIALAVDVPEDLPEIKCRSQQIQQVLMNLITNARDALNQKYPGHDDNKKISVTSSVCDKDGSRWVRTTVTDTGPGIPDKVRERMYEPFYTTKPLERGTGLGLSISDGIIKDHGGNLTVETELGEWTRFHMDLPAGNG